MAIDCALRSAGEIVSADSMQIYKYMDIGTAKPTAEQQSQVPYHLIDIVEPDQPYSVAQYQEQAQQVIASIHSRGKLPLLVGGSVLYVRSVIGPLDFPIAGADPQLRQSLEEEANRLGTEHLHGELAKVDPEAAARIHPHDQKRIIRALEVYHLTGRPISHYQKLDRTRSPQYNVGIFGLTMPRSDLYGRIEKRVDEMMQRGLVEEVRWLLQQGYHRDQVSMKGLGYQQIAGHLAGEYDLATAIELLKRDTRRFAKRQMTWFRSEPKVRWLDLVEVGGTKAAAQMVAAWGERGDQQ